MSEHVAKYAAFVRANPDKARHLEQVVRMFSYCVTSPKSLVQLEAGYTVANVITMLHDAIGRGAEPATEEQREQRAALYGEEAQQAEETAAAEPVSRGAGNMAEVGYRAICEVQCLAELLIRKALPIGAPKPRASGLASPRRRSRAAAGPQLAGVLAQVAKTASTAASPKKWPAAHIIILLIEVVKVALLVLARKGHVSDAWARLTAPSGKPGVASWDRDSAAATNGAAPANSQTASLLPQQMPSTTAASVDDDPSLVVPSVPEAEPIDATAAGARSAAPARTVTGRERFVAFLDLLQVVRPVLLAFFLLPHFRPSVAGSAVLARRGAGAAGAWRAWTVTMAVEAMLVLAGSVARAGIPPAVGAPQPLLGALPGDKTNESSTPQIAAAERARMVAMHLVRAPFFTVFLRPVVVQWILKGFIVRRVPLLGALLGNAVEYALAMQGQSFEFTLGSNVKLF